MSSGGKQRTLSLKSGGTIVHALENWDDANRSYSYTMLSGPAPVANYHSIISVTGNAKGSVFKWMGSYDAKDTVMGAPVKKLLRGWCEGTHRQLNIAFADVQAAD